MKQVPCRVCNSIVREEVENLLSENVPMKQIAVRYRSLFDTPNVHLLEQSIAVHRKHLRVERELTPEELNLLKRFEKGEVSVGEMSRIVAVKVLDKMLRNPNDFRFIDFFRVELLRQKEDETKIKSDYAQRLVDRFFGGKLPAKVCPNCGLDLLPDSPQKTSSDNKSYLEEETIKEPIYED